MHIILSGSFNLVELIPVYFFGVGWLSHWLYQVDYFLQAHQSNRVCNALALLQCLASHPATRSEFLTAQIPLYLYSFLSTNSRNRPFEYLRLTSLGVIGALAKVCCFCTKRRYILCLAFSCRPMNRRLSIFFSIPKLSHFVCILWKLVRNLVKQ